MDFLSLNPKRIKRALIALTNLLEKVGLRILKSRITRLSYLNWVGLNLENLKRLKVR